MGGINRFLLVLRAMNVLKLHVVLTGHVVPRIADIHVAISQSVLEFVVVFPGVAIRQLEASLLGATALCPAQFITGLLLPGLCV